MEGAVKELSEVPSTKKDKRGISRSSTPSIPVRHTAKSRAVLDKKDGGSRSTTPTNPVRPTTKSHIASTKNNNGSRSTTPTNPMRPTTKSHIASTKNNNGSRSTTPTNLVYDAAKGSTALTKKNDDVGIAQQADDDSPNGQLVMTSWKVKSDHETNNVKVPVTIELDDLEREMKKVQLKKGHESKQEKESKIQENVGENSHTTHPNHDYKTDDSSKTEVVKPVDNVSISVTKVEEKTEPLKDIQQKGSGHKRSDAVHLKKKNYCFILCNSEFDDEKNLYGYVHDVTRIKKTFEYLNFDVICEENKTAEEMNLIFSDWKDKLSDADECLVIFILSHGKDNGVVLGTDGGLINIGELKCLFSDKNCTELSGKPKLIFLQACRGNLPPVASEYQSAGVSTAHIYHNTLVYYSTTEGFYGLVNRKEGSPFIQKICECLKKLGVRRLSTLITMVNKMMSVKIMSHDGTNIVLEVAHSLCSDMTFGNAEDHGSRSSTTSTIPVYNPASSTTSPTKKNNGNRSGSTVPPTTVPVTDESKEPKIGDLKFDHIKRLTEFLDPRSVVANWKNLGKQFAFRSDTDTLRGEIDHLTIQYYGGNSPGEALLEYLEEVAVVEVKHFVEVMVKMKKPLVARLFKNIQYDDETCLVDCLDDAVRKKIIQQLDRRIAGANNWPDIANAFKCTSKQIEAFKNNRRQEIGSPTESLIQMMKTSKPEYKLSELKLDLAKIRRNDVAQYIDEVIREINSGS